MEGELDNGVTWAVMNVEEETNNEHSEGSGVIAEDATPDVEDNPDLQESQGEIYEDVEYLEFDENAEQELLQGSSETENVAQNDENEEIGENQDLEFFITSRGNFSNPELLRNTISELNQALGAYQNLPMSPILSTLSKSPARPDLNLPVGPLSRRPIKSAHKSPPTKPIRKMNATSPPTIAAQKAKSPEPKKKNSPAPGTSATIPARKSARLGKKRKESSSPLIEPTLKRTRSAGRSVVDLQALIDKPKKKSQRK